MLDIKEDPFYWFGGAQQQQHWVQALLKSDDDLLTTQGSIPTAFVVYCSYDTQFETECGCSHDTQYEIEISKVVVGAHLLKSDEHP